jgi:hypothetical protein
MVASILGSASSRVFGVAKVSVLETLRGTPAIRKSKEGAQAGLPTLPGEDHWPRGVVRGLPVTNHFSLITTHSSQLRTRR